MRHAARLVFVRCFALAALALCAAGASAQTAVPRSEAPRPDFVRADWQTLNGQWEFEFDDADRGVAERWYAPASKNEWGYSGIEPTKEAMLKRLDGLVKAVVANKVWGGFCYTQLTDVEQEINGLMTYDRKPKAAPEEFQKIFGQR